MNYPLVSVPLFAKKDFFSFTKVEAKRYLDWFLEIRSERQSILKNDEQIHKTPLFVDNIPINEQVFTDETVSICFDIGIYLGQILMRNIEELRWSYKVTSINFIYYAQPILIGGNSKFTSNPRAAIEGIASRILDQDSSEITFEELYNRLNKNYR